jgi:hypothetical protein
MWRYLGAGAFFSDSCIAAYDLKVLLAMEWVCHAVRAPGSKMTLVPTTRAVGTGLNSGSTRTLPVQ